MKRIVVVLFALYVLSPISLHAMQHQFRPLSDRIITAAKNGDRPALLKLENEVDELSDLVTKRQKPQLHTLKKQIETALVTLSSQEAPLKLEKKQRIITSEALSWLPAAISVRQTHLTKQRKTRVLNSVNSYAPRNDLVKKVVATIQQNDRLSAARAQSNYNIPLIVATISRLDKKASPELLGKIKAFDETIYNNAKENYNSETHTIVPKEDLSATLCSMEQVEQLRKLATQNKLTQEQAQQLETNKRILTEKSAAKRQSAADIDKLLNPPVSWLGWFLGRK